MNRMAYVCTDPGIPAFGRKGASVHVQAVLRVLVGAGVEVHLLCARTGGDAPAGLEQVVVHELPRVSGTSVADRELSAVASDAAVTRVLDDLDRAGPVDLVYERYALWGRSGTAWAARHGVPSVLEVNAPLIDEQSTHRGLADRDAAERVARGALGDATAVACVSERVTRWARERLADPRRAHTVANGVDTRRITPAAGAVTPPAADPFTVGFVGTLKPWHGVGTLVDALPELVRRHEGYRLLLVGDGPEATALAERADRLGVADHVEATGSVDPAEVPGLLRRMDVAAAPYPAMDDFYFSPLKVYEYLAAGLPVVASRVGSLPALLAYGDLGALVPPDDPSALAEAVEGLRLDPARRDRLRTAAVATAARHDWAHVVARTLQLADRRLREGHDVLV